MGLGGSKSRPNRRGQRPLVRILLLGSGGRESALAWALTRSSAVDLTVAPGNPGMAGCANTISIDPCNAALVVEAARLSAADLVIVGPEAPLVAGVADALRADGRAVFGPTATAARVESSKSYSKVLMERAGIPTARWNAFDSSAKAVAFMDELGPPYVIKADGLAAGKGVVVTEERGIAVTALQDMLEQRAFGAAGTTVVVEEYLDGEEISLIAFTDGRDVVACEVAQDYKRALDGDRGPNTGGMGSYSPVPACPRDLARAIVDQVMEPMVITLAAAGSPFVGALYAGLALTTRGPRVFEFNARFGDPETQALMPRMSSDLAEVCLATATGALAGTSLQWSPDACVSVVLASSGYPGAYPTGVAIHGTAEAQALEGVEVFHAGTAVVNGELVTDGGRVLSVSALGPTITDARRRAYEAASLIDFEGKHARSDIALRAEDGEGDD
jgi:phosphoribosylamine---glycine ligase